LLPSFAEAAAKPVPSTSIAMKTIPTRVSFHLALPMAAGLALVSGELKLKDGDHKNLSRLVAAYYTAKEEEKDINKTMQAVIDQVTVADKRLKDQKVLSFVSDWEQVFRLVSESRLKDTLKKKGDIEEKKVTSDRGIEVSFAYCAPKKPTKGVLPLILAVCDSGEAPTAHLNAYWNDPALREAALLMAVKMPPDTKSWGLFGSPEEPGGVFTVMTALGMISREFSVDPDRTFVVGSGKGFAAAEATAAAFPHVFAGLVGIGDVASTDLVNLTNFLTVPCALIKGGEGAKEIEDKIDELGFGNCTRLVAEREGQDAEGKPSKVWEPIKVWEWMGKNPRVAYPAHVSFSPRSDYARRAHWISLEGIQREEEPHVDAKADRATNTITVDTQKVSDVVIYLNDELVDLDKPVKLVINGKPQEHTVERNAQQMILWQYGSGDWGRVFTAALSVPAKDK